MWRRKLKVQLNGAETAPGKRRYSFLQGFLINMSNPSNWLFWLSLATVVKADGLTESGHYADNFLISTLVIVLTYRSGKVFMAHKIGQRLRPGVPEKIVRVAGIILIGVSS